MTTLKKLIAVFLLLLLPTPGLATWTVFDAVDDQVLVTSFSAIQGTVWSIGCWVSRDGDGEVATISNIMAKRAGGVGWRLYDTNNTDIRFWVERATTAGLWTVARPSNPFHVAVAYDSADVANDPDIYINGVLQTESEASTPSGAYTAGTVALSIGNRDVTDQTFNGKLGSCFYYDRKISADEAKMIMRLGPQTVHRGLICYWPLGVFQGQGVHGGATGGTSCNGTISGSPATSSTGPPVSIPQGGLYDGR